MDFINKFLYLLFHNAKEKGMFQKNLMKRFSEKFKNTKWQPKNAPFTLFWA